MQVNLVFDIILPAIHKSFVKKKDHTFMLLICSLSHVNTITTAQYNSEKK